MWQDEHVSLYSSQRDTAGRPSTLRKIILCDFARDLSNIILLKGLDRDDPDYNIKSKELKSTLQLFSPAALLKSRQKDHLEIIKHTGLMQLDFDYNSIKDYDIEELKRAVFALPFVAFVGLSCSGYGFYALIQIADPMQLAQYAEHCFQVFERYGIKPDTSKGRNAQDLRYVSYDANMLIRENPETLHVANFKTKQRPQLQNEYRYQPSEISGDVVVKNGLSKIRNVMVGNRWETVQKVAYTMGGLQDHSLLYLIQDEINNNNQFNGEYSKYIKCAEDCFNAGLLKPLSN